MDLLSEIYQLRKAEEGTKYCFGAIRVLGKKFTDGLDFEGGKRVGGGIKKKNSSPGYRGAAAMLSSCEVNGKKRRPCASKGFLAGGLRGCRKTRKGDAILAGEV